MQVVPKMLKATASKCIQRKQPITAQLLSLTSQCQSSQVLIPICISNCNGILERGTGGGSILKLHSICERQRWTSGSSRTSYRSCDQLPPACITYMHLVNSIINHADFPHPRYYIIGSVIIQSAIGTIETHRDHYSVLLNAKMCAQLCTKCNKL